MNASELRRQETFDAAVSRENELFSWETMQALEDGHILFGGVAPKEKLAELLELDTEAMPKISALMHPAGHLAFDIAGDWANFRFGLGELTPVDGELTF